MWPDETRQSFSNVDGEGAACAILQSKWSLAPAVKHVIDQISNNFVEQDTVFCLTPPPP